MDLSGRTIVVTGGSSGIGRETCLKAAEYGADIVVTDLVNEPRDGGQPTVEAVRELGQRSTFVEADVRELADMKAAIEVGNKFGGVDGVVNNAGYAQSHSLTDTGPDNWEKSITTNLTGVYHGCLAGVSRMVDTGGAIVNVASSAGVVGLVNTCSYSAAKGGVISLTRQIAVDYASEDIRVNAVSPGFTDTPLFREDTHDGTRKHAEHNTPMQRIGRPEEVANTIVYLLSDAASFITGENIIVDGGYAIE